MRRAHLPLLALLLLLPGLLLLPIWPLAGLGASEDDILYYYPTRAYFGESIAAGRFPQINPWTGLGRPVAADPQQAVWYPTTWLFAILPADRAYASGLYFHYALALLGMYRLLRGEQCTRGAAIFGGIAFAFCGFMLAHRAHFAIQHAAAWTPWVFWRAARYARHGDARRLASAAIVGALQCLTGHVQIAALTALGLLVFLVAARRQPTTVGTDGRIGRTALRWLLLWVTAGGLFAIQLFPTLLYLPECTRTERTFADFVENSWSPASAIGWILPMLLGQRSPNFFDQPYWGPSHQCEQFSYAGILPLILAAAALRSGWRTGRRRGWAILLLFALLLALGQYGPLCPLLYWLPGSSLFRVPARGMLLFQIAVAALAAFALDDLIRQVDPLRVRLRLTLQQWTRDAIANGLLAVVLAAALVALALPLLPAETRDAAANSVWPLSPAVLVPLAVAALSFLLLARLARRWQHAAPLLIASISLLALDLGVIGWTLDVPRRALAEFGRFGLHEYLASDEREAWLSELRRDQRAAPPSVEPTTTSWSREAVDGRLWVVTRRHGGTPGEYTAPLAKASADFNALLHVPALTDYGPLQPRAFAREFAFKPWGESDFAVRLLANTAWMPNFGVAWVLICEPDLPAPARCRLVTTTPGGMRLYRAERPIRPAYFADVRQPGVVRYEETGPERFMTTVDIGSSDVAKTNADVRLVISRAAIPGWQASIDGRALFIGAEGPLLAVDIPAGASGRIEWRYQTPGLRTGAVVSLALLAWMAFFLLRPRRKSPEIPKRAGRPGSVPTEGR